MSNEDLIQIQTINQQLEAMKKMGIIEDYSLEIGSSVATSSIKFSVRENMIPVVFKTRGATVH